MRGEGPIKSAIGSSRRAATGCGVTAVASSRAGIVGTPIAATGEAFGLAKKGVGCEPDCNKTALTTMMTLAAAAATMANESTGRRVALAHSRAANAPPALAARIYKRRSALRRLRTFLHPDIVNGFAYARRLRRNAARQIAHHAHGLQRSGRCRGSHPLAIERQPHRDARAFADAAADGDFAAMQLHQSLHDGEPEAGAAMAAVVGVARLEVWFADSRQIVIADADAVILDGKGDMCRLGTGADRDRTAAIGESDRIG